MSVEKKEVNIAIIGLGRVGSMFLNKLSEKERQGVRIVATAEKDQNAAGVKTAKGKGVTVYENDNEIIALGEKIDIIFDLTGNSESRRSLRSALARSGNQHTVLAPEVVAHLIWDMMDMKEQLPSGRGKGGY